MEDVQTNQGSSTLVATQPRRRRLLPILIAVLVIIFLIAFGGYQFIRASQSSPINFEVYPNAKLVNKKASTSEDTQVYTTPDSIVNVMNFYVQRYGEVNHPVLPNGQVDEAHSQDNGCLAVYLDNTQSNQPGGYAVRCIYDDAFADLSRTLQINITYDTTTKLTSIEVNRMWGG